MKGEDLVTTSKIHTFKPAVEIPEAVGWLLKHKSIDGAIIFDNDNSVMFVNGKFAQFIEVRPSPSASALPRLRSCQVNPS